MSTSPPPSLNSEARDLARKLLLGGFIPVPLLHASKQPAVKNWNDPDRAWRAPDWMTPGVGIGVLTGVGGLIGVDIDTDDPDVHRACGAVLPRGCPGKKGRKGQTLFVRAPSVQKRVSLPVGFAIVDGKWSVAKVELLTVGQQTVLPPSLHPDTRSRYEWIPSDDGVLRKLYGMKLDDVPLFLEDFEAALIRALHPFLLSRELINACNEVALATKGERNDRLNKETFKLIKAAVGIDDALARKWLTEAASFAGLEGTEVEATIKSASQQEPAKSRATKNGSKAQGLVTVCAADITPKPVSWVWRSRIARGKPTLIAGEPGASKSQLAVSIAAAVTRGAEWPCGEGCAPQGNVIILSAEDSAADTIVPRLMAAGADLRRIKIVDGVRTDDGQRAFNIKTDLGVLEVEIVKIGEVVLVEIDPVTSYMGDADSNSTTAMRAVLDPITRMAERLDVAVIAVHHFRKQGSGDAAGKAAHRILGSMAFVAAARVAFAVVEDPETPGRRLFVNCKPPSTERAPPGLAYTLEPTEVLDGIVATRVVWDAEPINVTADQILAEVAESGETQTARAAILDLLQAVPGYMETTTPKDIAKELGRPYEAVKRCLARMAKAGVVARDSDSNYYHASKVPPAPNAASSAWARKS